MRRVVCASPTYLAAAGRPRLLCNTNEAAIDAALQGWGISRLLSYQVAADIPSGRLEVVLADFEEPALAVHVVHAD